MESSFNFSLSDKKPLSKLCIDKDLNDFLETCNYVKRLQYGRNSNKNSLSLVLTEQKGTCSTKHAFLAKVVKENNINDIFLFIGVYKMSTKNTPGIGDTLQKYNLDYIPEAHTYLKHDDIILDFTSTKEFSFEKYLLYEEKIIPLQIGDYKVSLHQSFIKKWIAEESIPYSFEDIWKIREQCIFNLSQ